MNIEVKKDGLRQTQDGLWKLTLTVQPADMPVPLMQAAMGQRYYVAFVDADEYEQSGSVGTDGAGLTPASVAPLPPLQGQRNEGHSVRKESLHTEKPARSAGERARTRAVLLCKDGAFRAWIASRDEYWPHDAEPRDYILEVCGITSRSELATNATALQRFLDMEMQYRADTGQMAEPR